LQPLSGTRVLDLTRLIPGPFATLVLADLGARVDKVEDPGGGDYLRHMPPAVGGTSAAFGLLNRGKRSAILDLKKADGRAALEKIVTSYDVLFEQFRPGVLARLGLSPAALLEQNPRLIVCSLTGYGQTGALAAKAGHDLNYLARAGLLGAQGPAHGPPAVPGFQLADVSGGLWCVVAIQAALAERARTGRGQHLDIAMTDGVLGFYVTSLGPALAGQPAGRGQETLTGGIAPYATYLTADGYAMTLAALEPKFWSSFCAAFDLRADMGALLPGPHQEALGEQVRGIFASKNRAEWIAWAAEHDCMVEPVLAPEELVADEHIRSRDLLFELDTPAGPIPQFRTPVTPSGNAFAPPPGPGEHTRAILEEGGLPPGDIDALFESGAAR
jgi:alpha-methylacyl-CoA racemase